MKFLDFSRSPIVRAWHFAVQAFRPDGKEHFSIGRYDPSIESWGMLPNPDEVLEKHSNGQGIPHYRQVRRQLPYVGGLCESRKSAALSLPIVWRAGDEDDPKSQRIAQLAESSWKAIPNLIVGLHAWCDAIFDGVAFAELIWSPQPIEVEKGEYVFAPISIHDRPAERFTFDADQKPRFLSVNNPWRGEPVEDRRLMVFTYGSLDTPWGHAETKDIYPACWLYDKLQKVGLRALEKEGEPVALCIYPGDWGDEERAKFETAIRKTHRAYILVPSSDVTEPEISFPSRDAISRSPSDVILKVMDRLETAIATRLHGSKKSTGSEKFSSNASDRTKEEDRFEKTAIDGAALVAAINASYVRWFVEINFPGTPTRLWPRCDIDTTPTEDLRELTERIEAGQRIGLDIDPEWAAESLKIKTTTPDKALKRRSSPIPVIGQPVAEDDDVIEGEIVPERKALPPAKEEEEEKSPKELDADSGFLLFADGRLVEIPTDAPIMTRRGLVTYADLRDDDEIIVARTADDSRDDHPGRKRRRRRRKEKPEQGEAEQDPGAPAA